MREPATSHRIARLCIWTLRRQSQIAYHLKVFTWSATAIVMLLALAGRISFDTALHTIVISLLTIASLVWALIRARHASLLAIEDPDMRRRAHETMLALIQQRPLSTVDRKLLQQAFGERHCELGHCRRTRFQ